MIDIILARTFWEDFDAYVNLRKFHFYYLIEIFSPAKPSFIRNNKRGLSVCFNEAAVNETCRLLNISLIVRGHQVNLKFITKIIEFFHPDDASWVQVFRGSKALYNLLSS